MRSTSAAEEGARVKTRSLPMCHVMLRVVSSMLWPACAQHSASACAPEHDCVASLAELSLVSHASGGRHSCGASLQAHNIKPAIQLQA